MSFTKIGLVKTLLSLAAGLNLCLVFPHILSDFCKIQYMWSNDNDVERRWVS
jgi:hypothetical protein